MDLQKPPAGQPQPQARDQQPPPEGCLVVAVRIPVRIVVLVLVVPVRLVWDALVAAGRVLNEVLLRPLGRALLWLAYAVLVWPWVMLWRYGAVPAGRALAWLAHVLLAVPLTWLYAHVLAPLGRLAGAGLAWLYRRVCVPVGRGVAWVLRGLWTLLAAAGAGGLTVVSWLVRHLVVEPVRLLYAWVLAPVGRALAWLTARTFEGVGLVLYWICRVLVVLPALALLRWVLVPVGRVLAVLAREVGAALGHAWRIAGHVSRAVGGFLAVLFRWIFVEPVRWVYRTVLTPLGHVVRDMVWRPAAAAARRVRGSVRQALTAARETARQVRADVRRALFGLPPRPEAVDRREPGAERTRTLEERTGREVSPPTRG